MKKHLFFLVVLLLIVAMASPIWANQKHKKASWEAGMYQYCCRNVHELAVKSLRAFRGLMMAHLRSPAIDLLLPEPADPEVIKKDSGAAAK